MKNIIKKIIINYLMFILPTIVVGIILIMENQKPEIVNSFPKLEEILASNFTILFLLISLGIIHRYLTYVLFFWNAIIFSVFILIYGDFFGAIVKVLPYGLFEILALSIACYIGNNIKTMIIMNILKLSIIAIILMFISALIEIYLIKGVL